MKQLIMAVLIPLVITTAFGAEPLLGPANENEAKSIVLGLEKRPSFNINGHRRASTSQP